MQKRVWGLGRGSGLRVSVSRRFEELGDRDKGIPGAVGSRYWGVRSFGILRDRITRVMSALLLVMSWLLFGTSSVSTMEFNNPQP